MLEWSLEASNGCFILRTNPYVHTTCQMTELVNGHLLPSTPTPCLWKKENKISFFSSATELKSIINLLYYLLHTSFLYINLRISHLRRFVFPSNYKAWAYFIFFKELFLSLSKKSHMYQNKENNRYR